MSLLQEDIVNVFNALFEIDRCKELSLVNGAILITVVQISRSQGIWDYKPISLIHSFGKLVSKVIANRLAP